MFVTDLQKFLIKKVITNQDNKKLSIYTILTNTVEQFNMLKQVINQFLLNNGYDTIDTQNTNIMKYRKQNINTVIICDVSNFTSEKYSSYAYFDYLRKNILNKNEDNVVFFITPANKFNPDLIGNISSLITNETKSEIYFYIGNQKLSLKYITNMLNRLQEVIYDWKFKNIELVNFINPRTYLIDLFIDVPYTLQDMKSLYHPLLRKLILEESNIITKNSLNMLFIGNYGTGKTVFSNIVSVARRSLTIQVSMFKVFNSEFGETENKLNMNLRNLYGEIFNVHRTFNNLRFTIIFDEFDKMIGVSNNGANCDSICLLLKRISGIIAQIIDEYKLLMNKTNVINIFTANHIQYIDPMLLRTGRINYTIYFPFFELINNIHTQILVDKFKLDEKIINELKKMNIPYLTISDIAAIHKMINEFNIDLNNLNELREYLRLLNFTSKFSNYTISDNKLYIQKFLPAYKIF